MKTAAATFVFALLTVSQAAAQSVQIGTRPIYDRWERVRVNAGSLQTSVFLLTASWAEELAESVDTTRMRISRNPVGKSTPELQSALARLDTLLERTLLRPEPSHALVAAVRGTAAGIRNFNLEDEGGRSELRKRLDEVGSLLSGEPTGAEWLPESSLSYAAEAVKAAVTALVLYWYPTESFYIPIVVRTSLPTIPDTTADRVVNDVLDEYGGLMNIALARGGRVGGRLDPFKGHPTLGIFGEIRVSGKMVEEQGAGVDFDRLRPFGSLNGTVRYVTPISRKGLRKYDDGQRAGLVTLTASVNSQFSAKSDYVQPGNYPVRFAHVNLHLSAFATDIFYFAAGWTAWASHKEVSKRFYLSVAGNQEGKDARRNPR